MGSVPCKSMDANPGQSSLARQYMPSYMPHKCCSSQSNVCPECCSNASGCNLRLLRRMWTPNLIRLWVVATVAPPPEACGNPACYNSTGICRTCKPAGTLPNTYLCRSTAAHDPRSTVTWRSCRLAVNRPATPSLLGPAPRTPTSHTSMDTSRRRKSPRRKCNSPCKWPNCCSS